MKGKTRKTLKKILIVVLGLGLSIALLPGALAEREAPVISLSSGEGQRLQASMTERQAAAGYIARVMTGMKSRGTVAGDQLTGPEAKLYAAARERIALVAAGRTGDTEFRIPLADIYDQLEYTAEELGVDCIFDIEGDTADFNEEALSAFSAATAVDVDRVTQSLLFDCPYDLYWFDKTAGYSYSTGYITGRFGAERKDDTIGFAVAEDDCATYSLCVSAGYSVSGAAGTFAFDTSYGTRAAAAAANARQAVSANAGKGDAEKLAAYKEYICDAVDYNDEAAYDGATPYGDPWQLVYVFDGDSSTKVVCEGYSKAFQFLCDESSFSGGVSAISVSGTMSGGTGAGNHMWNIVTMGGLHYLADITNSDDGSVGYQGDLFLKGYTEKLSETAYVYRAGGTDITYEYDEGTVTLLGSTGRLAVASEEDRSEVAVSCGGYIGPDVTVTVSGLEQSRRYLEIFWLGEDGSQSESVLWDESVKDTETYMGFAFLRPGNYEVRLQAIQGDYPDPESDPLAATAAFTLQSRTLPTATVTLSANPAAFGDELTYTVSGAEAVADHIWMADARTGEELWGSNPPWSSCTAGSTGTLNYGNEPGVLHGEIWGRFDGVWSDPVEIQVEIESEGDQEELQVTPDYNILLNIKDASFTLSVENPDRVVVQLWNQENEWENILDAENPGTSVSFAEAELPEDFTEGLFRFCAQKDGRWTAWSSGWHVFVTTKLPFCSWNGMDEATCYPDTAPLNEPENDVLQQEPFVTQYWLNAQC